MLSKIRPIAKTPPLSANRQLTLFDVFLAINPGAAGLAQPVEPARTNRFQLPDDAAPSGEITRIRANLAAIQLCKELLSANRLATPAEWGNLAAFSGWGGLAGLWDEAAHAIESIEEMNAEQHRWYNRYKMLRQQADQLLSAEECGQASSSSLSAFYTPPALVESIWELLSQAGFAGGRVLDPAAGTGHFIGAMPIQLRENSVITAVEKDPLSAAILTALYPDVTAHASGIENAPLPNESFDLIVGNVPFGDFRVFDAAERDWCKYPIHNYFIGKAARLIAPGGLVCLISSMGTLDQSSKAFRLTLDAARMELLGAIRLPSCTFEKNAGTQVTTDMLLFQKRPEAQPRTALANAFVNTATLKTGGDEPVGEEPEQERIIPSIEVNQYFVEHPHMMLGEMNFASQVNKGGLYRGDRQTLFLADSNQLYPRLRTAVDQLSQQIPGAFTRFAQRGQSRSQDGHKEHYQLAGSIKINGRQWNKQSIYRSYVSLKHLFFDLLKPNKASPMPIVIRSETNYATITAFLRAVTDGSVITAP